MPDWVGDTHSIAEDVVVSADRVVVVGAVGRVQVRQGETVSYKVVLELFLA